MSNDDVLQENEKRGTYMAAKIDEESCKKIKKFCLQNNIPNRVETTNLHTTIIYSRASAPNLTPSSQMYPLEAKCTSLITFETSLGKNVLVLKLDSPELLEYHNNLMKEHNTTYDYPEYIPHITISYDCGGFNPNSFIGELPTVRFVSEYVEDLVLNWQNS